MEIKYYKDICVPSCDRIQAKTIANIAKKLKLEVNVNVFEGKEFSDMAGVMEIPALVFKNKVVLSGHTPSNKEIEELLSKTIRKAPKKTKK
ncbi:MAG: thioredoxin family protein [Mycoplasmataceae bacterium]|nr:thioredoxin family protein [Mycoplasmataceae bacterium]